MDKYSGFLIRESLKLIHNYGYAQPLSRYLKEYFNLNRNSGSRDRKFLRELVYVWFRTGKSLEIFDDETRLKLSFFLAGSRSSQQLAEKLFTDEKISSNRFQLSVQEKINIVKENFSEFNPDAIFPFEPLTGNIPDFSLFRNGFLVQPLVWIRIKRGHNEKVFQEFESRQITMFLEDIRENAFAVSQNINVQDTVSWKSGYIEIQDLSSQCTGDLFKPSPGESWYDCCAASGGKSLMLMDMQPGIQLTVSDSRGSILNSLSERFKRSGIKNYNAFAADLTQSLHHSISSQLFEGIILDAPCTGSGTWSRTPEEMSSFTPEKLKKYVKLQRNIFDTVSNSVKPGCPLIYITCSVFKEENEAFVDYATSADNFKAEDIRYFQNTQYHADTLFAARLIRK